MPKVIDIPPNKLITLRASLDGVVRWETKHITVATANRLLRDMAGSSYTVEIELGPTLH